MVVLFSSDLVNSTEPVEMEVCASCGESPDVGFVGGWPDSIYCPKCGAKSTAEEFSEALCAWNRANSGKAYFEKYFFGGKKTEATV